MDNGAASEQAYQLDEQPGNIPALSLIESMADALVFKDRDLKIKAVNEAYCRMLGRERKAILGHTDFDLYEEKQARTQHDSDRLVLESGSPLAIDRGHGDGDAMKYFHIVKTPVRDSEGAIAGVLVSIRDISDLKRMELELVRRGKALEVISRAAAHFHDSDLWERELPEMLQNLCRILDLDRAHIYTVHGNEPAELQLELIYEWVDASRFDREESKTLKKIDVAGVGMVRWAEALSHGEIVFARTHDMPPDERVFFEDRKVASGAAFPIFSGKRLWGVFAIASNRGDCALSHTMVDTLKTLTQLLGNVIGQIEEQQQRHCLEARLEQARKMESLGVLAGGIAHDFNNLLQGILGNAEFALMGLSAQSQNYGCLQEIVKASRRAADLAAQMLAYAGRSHIFAQTADLNRTLEDSEICDDLARDFEIGLTILPYESLPPVSIDHIQVRHLIRNLLINAFESMNGRKGGVRISTHLAKLNTAYLRSECAGSETLEGGQYVALEIADDGCGMDDKTLSKVFDPFFTTKFPGRGLGLAASLGIVRGHRGAIRIASTPGKGSTATVYLPALDAPEAVPKRRPPEKCPAKQKTGVLVIDDESLVRSFVTRMLTTSERWDVDEADDGARAIAMFRKEPERFDIAVVDLAMPGLDGIETIERLREVRPDLNVILSSGYGEEQLREHSQGIDIQGFLQKPYRAKQLLETLERVMA